MRYGQVPAAGVQPARNLGVLGGSRNSGWISLTCVEPRESLIHVLEFEGLDLRLKEMARLLYAQREDSLTRGTPVAAQTAATDAFVGQVAPAKYR
jgi:hypothetical protein